MSGVGALATQALVNPTFGPRGLRLLADGVPAADIVRVLLARMTGRETRRSMSSMPPDAMRRIPATIVSAGCGHLVCTGFSVAGNMLAGPDVIADTAAFYEANACCHSLRG